MVLMYQETLGSWAQRDFLLRAQTLGKEQEREYIRRGQEEETQGCMARGTGEKPRGSEAGQTDGFWILREVWNVVNRWRARILEAEVCG